MLLSLYQLEGSLDRNNLRDFQEKLHSVLRSELFDPASKVIASSRHLMTFYKKSANSLIGNLVLGSKLHRTDLILLRFCQIHGHFYEFGRLISCESFRALLEAKAFSTEEEVEIRRGLAQDRYEDIMKKTLKETLDSSSKYSDWFNNKNFLMFFRRRHLLPKAEGMDDIELISEIYEERTNKEVPFNACLRQDLFNVLDDLALPLLDEIDFGACRNLASLKYVLGRINVDMINEEDLVMIYTKVLSVPGVSRLDALQDHFGIAASEAAKDDEKSWQKSLLQVAKTADSETTRQYFNSLKSVVKKINRETVFDVFVERGSYFYLDAIKWYDNMIGDSSEMRPEHFYPKLYLLRDATLLAEYLERMPPRYGYMLNDMLISCYRLKYESHDVCSTQTRVVVGMAMAEVIMSKIKEFDLDVAIYECVIAAAQYGCAEMLEHALNFDEDGYYSIGDIAVSRSVDIDFKWLAKERPDGYREIDYKKVMVLIKKLKFPKELFVWEAVRDINDNAGFVNTLLGDNKTEILKRFGEGLQALVNEAFRLGNYRILVFGLVQ